MFSSFTGEKGKLLMFCWLRTLLIVHITIAPFTVLVIQPPLAISLVSRVGDPQQDDLGLQQSLRHSPTSVDE